MSVAVSGGGSIVNTNANTITGDFSGFTGSYTHNSELFSSVFNTAVSTSKDAAYVLASAQGSQQGFIAAGAGDYTLQMGSLSGVANSLVRGGNAATGTTTLEIGNLNTSTIFNGSINNGATKSLALTKVGTGSLTLNGSSNTYTGATNINAGTLTVNGTLASTTINVASNATLNGSGTMAGSTLTVNGTLNGTGSYGATTIASGGLLSPGNSPGNTSHTSLTMANGSNFNWELIGNTTSNSPLSFDTVTVSGTLSIGNISSTLTFGSGVDWTDSFWMQNQTWTVFPAAL